MPPISGSASIKAKSSPTRSSRGVKSSAQGGEGKKFGSLSSFQATLNFSALPASTSAPSRLGSQSAASSKGKERERPGSTKNGEDEDKKLMPPPPAGLQTKSRATNESGLGGTNGKLNGKRVKIVLSDSDDEHEGGISSESPGMWADVYAPKNETDLAPNKKKVTKVKDWIQEALYGFPPDAPGHYKSNKSATDKVRKYKRILLLSGPAGAGKTTTVRVLAREMGVDLLEWGEGAEEWGMGGGTMDRESSITKLTTFLSRNTYAPLSLSSSSSSAQSARPRIIFLTALPNISHGATKDSFHAALGEFCKRYTSSSCPMIIVHSEAGSSGVAEESWRDRERGGREGTLQVLGKDVKDGPWCQEIEFLPVAPTFQIKALKRVLEQAASTSSFPQPSTAAVQLLSFNSNGDLRSAVNSLQLLCTQIRSHKGKRINSGGVDEGGGKRRKVNGTGRGSRGGRGAKLDVPDDLRAVLDALTRKEQSLHLFHALGKVLYNKRLDDPKQDNDDQELAAEIRQLPPDEPLPLHLEEFERRKSLIQMEAFTGSVPIDASSFTLWLHQSLPCFCTTIDEAAVAADEMCAADIMRTDDDIWQSSTQAISYALQISIRGAQLSLPSPVIRNHQKILKPQFFQAFKDEKRNIELMDTAAAYLAKKGTAASVALAELDMVAGSGEYGDRAVAMGVWGGVVSRNVLSCEVVPMLVKMQGLTTKPLLPASVAPLRMPLYTQSLNISEELTASQTDMEDPADGDETDQGVLSVGWDKEEQGEETKVEEKGWLEDDDIQDWD